MTLPLRLTGVAAYTVALMVIHTMFSTVALAAQVQSYTIDAVFAPAEGRMSAVADVRFVPGTVTGATVVFYLHGELRVDSVKVGGTRVEAVQDLVFHEDDYSHVSNRIEVSIRGLDFSEGMQIGYRGYFNPSVVRAMSNYMRIDGDGVYLRSLGYSLWFPVFVEGWKNAYDVAFPSVTLRTPGDFTAVFAGDRLREYDEGTLKVSEWKAERLSLFDAQCTARRYDVMTDGGFQLYHLGDPVAREKAGEILAFVHRLESLYNAYYRKSASAAQLHIMQMPKYGDISSANVIGISDAVWNQFEVTAWQGRTVAHELVHPFVSVPSSDELGAFVVEGFPSFFYLPVLAEILGEKWYGDFLKRVENAYIQNRETGKNRRGEQLPPEKPILEITYDEIGVYKDKFVLNDRVRLFFDYLRRRLGSERFFDLSSDLMNLDTLDYEILVTVVESYLPECGDDVRRWLKTTEFPDEFRSNSS